jgi:hypothetical protein
MTQILEILGEIAGRPLIVTAVTEKDLCHAQQTARVKVMAFNLA